MRPPSVQTRRSTGSIQWLDGWVTAYQTYTAMAAPNAAEPTASSQSPGRRRAGAADSGRARAGCRAALTAAWPLRRNSPEHDNGGGHSPRAARQDQRVSRESRVPRKSRVSRGTLASGAPERALTGGVDWPGERLVCTFL